MNAKAYLKQYKHFLCSLQNKQQMLEDMRSEAYSIGAIDYGKPTVKKSASNEAGYTKIVERMADLERKINTDVCRLFEMKYKLEAEIGMVEDADCYNLLYKRYIQLKQWDLIAVEMNYSFGHVTGFLHNKALTLFAEVMEGKE